MDRAKGCQVGIATWLPNNSTRVTTHVAFIKMVSTVGVSMIVVNTISLVYASVSSVTIVVNRKGALLLQDHNIPYHASISNACILLKKIGNKCTLWTRIMKQAINYRNGHLNWRRERKRRWAALVPRFAGDYGRLRCLQDRFGYWFLHLNCFYYKRSAIDIRHCSGIHNFANKTPILHQNDET